jgi:hypothetical protein
MKKYVPHAHPFIIYKATGYEYAVAYRHLIDEYRYCHWIKQTNFRYDVMNLLCADTTAFLTDDDVFVNHYRPGTDEYNEFIRNDKIACLSLRLHPNVTYSYTKDIPLEPPQFTPGRMRIFTWQGRKSYWGYPMSVDGHIFKTEDLNMTLSAIDFNNPNELEGMMAADPIDRPQMICYDKPKIINIPLNLVNDTVNNRNMQWDAMKMNDRFMNGYRLQIDVPQDLDSCHMEIIPKWVKAYT